MAGFDPSKPAEPGHVRSTPLARLEVAYFREKPDAREARALLRRGCLWNTMVMALSKPRPYGLWAGSVCPRRCTNSMRSFWCCVPYVKGVCAHSTSTFALERLYEELPSADFSKDILQHVPSKSRLLPMEGVDWCDWGRPQSSDRDLGSPWTGSSLPSYRPHNVWKPAPIVVENGPLLERRKATGIGVRRIAT